MPEKHEYESLIKCPYCGHEDEDSWELGESTDDYDCSSCGETFSVVADVEVTYSTCPTPCDKRDEPEAHNYEHSHYVESRVKYSGVDFEPREKPVYFEVLECSKCLDTEYRDMTKEEYEYATAKQ